MWRRSRRIGGWSRHIWRERRRRIKCGWSRNMWRGRRWIRCGYKFIHM
jgi:hypothetical protein